MKKLSTPNAKDTYRLPSQPEVEARITATVIYDTNFVPSWGDDPAFANRLNLIAFRHPMAAFAFQAPGHGDDRLAKYFLANEAEGVLRWFIEGAVQYAQLKGDLEVPVEFLEIKADIATAAQGVEARFFDEMTEPDPYGEIESDEAHGVFAAWHADVVDARREVSDKKNFAMWQTRHGYKRRESRVRMTDGSRRRMYYLQGRCWTEYATRYLTEVRANARWQVAE
jgi:phage/plasmid-associated DNA primase